MRFLALRPCFKSRVRKRRADFHEDFKPQGKGNDYYMVSERGISPDWRVGFEIELILNDLDDPDFAEEGSMDEASQEYCDAVANILTEGTGRAWSASDANDGKLGFQVVSEYDIDPTLFDIGDQIAGVELKTPPLPVDEADQLRGEILETLGDYGAFDAIDNETTNSLGWHVNIDCRSAQLELDPARYSSCVDEVAMLLSSGRLGRRETGLQRHAWGATLLRELSDGNRQYAGPEFLPELLYGRRGRGKSYAANFERSAYLELRHFGTARCFGDEPLTELIGEVLTAFQWNEPMYSERKDQLWRRFEVLRHWIDDVKHELTLAEQARGLTWWRAWVIEFSGEACGHATNQGTASFEIYKGMSYELAAGAYNQSMADIPEVFGLLSLDIAETYLLTGQLDFLPPNFSRAIADLAGRLEDAGCAPQSV